MKKSNIYWVLTERLAHALIFTTTISGSIILITIEEKSEASESSNWSNFIEVVTRLELTLYVYYKLAHIFLRWPLGTRDVICGSQWMLLKGKQSSDFMLISLTNYFTQILNSNIPIHTLQNGEQYSAELHN